MTETASWTELRWYWRAFNLARPTGPALDRQHMFGFVAEGSYGAYFTLSCIHAFIIIAWRTVSRCDQIEPWTIRSLRTLYGETLLAILTWLAFMISELVTCSRSLFKFMHPSVLGADCAILALLWSRKVSMGMSCLHRSFRTEVPIRTSFHVVRRKELVIG